MSDIERSDEPPKPELTEEERTLIAIDIVALGKELAAIIHDEAPWQRLADTLGRRLPDRDDAFTLVIQFGVGADR